MTQSVILTLTSEEVKLVASAMANSVMSETIKATRARDNGNMPAAARFIDRSDAYEAALQTVQRIRTEAGL